ncbi:DUF6461 domain-containing protein [Streptomyces sp. NBC_00178]|uniref:DUF6461 domain-containing protein n=1 Tax=Streptomyces sp. NBC_00178 TaxID=2975672 RepID=UPI002E27B08D|nr:DUF6461 domain-containing protein [Streptomyces sp. NBC_00178]
MADRSTAADYGWLEEQYPSLMEAYCVTLARGLTPDALLAALGVATGERVTGVRAMEVPAYERFEDDGHFVGVTAVGDWSLMVEYNGFVGVTDALMLPISRGREVVSHFRNVNAVDHFCWFEDGTTRLHFEPLFAHQRDGSHPDGILTEMEGAGFDMDETDECNFERHTEAAFALAERLTGVRLTPEVLASAEFTCGRVPDPLG